MESRGRGASDSITRDEFDFGRARARFMGTNDFESEPLLLVIEFDGRWSRACMPGRKQIRFVAIDKRRIARAHQRFGGRRRLAGVIAATTQPEFAGRSTGTAIDLYHRRHTTDIN